MQELTTRPPQWLLGILLYVAIFVPYAATVSSDVVNTDVAANSLTAWQIAHTGKPWMDGLDLTEKGEVSHYGVGRDGHDVTTRTPGQIWAAVPFYLGSTPRQEELTSFTRSGLAAAALTAGAVVLMWRAIGQVNASPPTRWGATGLLAFATPMWSVSGNALWTHPVTVLGISAAALAAARERWWLVGGGFALAMTARIHVAIIAALVGLGVAYVKRRWRIVVEVAAPTLLCIGLLSLWSQYVFGSWDPRGAYSNHDMSSLVPGVSQGPGYLENLAGFLISPEKGLIVWTPLLVLLLPSVFRGFRAAPPWTRWFAIGGVAFGLAQVGVNVFHGGDAFYGYRLGLETLVSVFPLYVACARFAGGWAQTLAPIVIGVQLAAFVLGSAFEWTNFIVLDDEAWTRNSLIASFFEVPVLIPAFAITAIAAAMLARFVIRQPVRSDSQLVTSRT